MVFYEELINKRKVAVKCINVTKSYSMMKISSMKKGLKLTIALEEILGVTLSEAVTQDKIQHKNILKCNESWIQFSDLNKIELNISMPLCDCNFSEYLAKTKFDFCKIKKFLLQITDALKYLRD